MSLSDSDDDDDDNLKDYISIKITTQEDFYQENLY